MYNKRSVTILDISDYMKRTHFFRERISPGRRFPSVLHPVRFALAAVLHGTVELSEKPPLRGHARDPSFMCVVNDPKFVFPQKDIQKETEKVEKAGDELLIDEAGNMTLLMRDQVEQAEEAPKRKKYDPEFANSVFSSAMATVNLPCFPSQADYKELFKATKANPTSVKHHMMMARPVFWKEDGELDIKPLVNNWLENEYVNPDHRALFRKLTAKDIIMDLLRELLERDEVKEIELISDDPLTRWHAHKLQAAVYDSKSLLIRTIPRSKSKRSPHRGVTVEADSRARLLEESTQGAQAIGSVLSFDDLPKYWAYRELGVLGAKRKLSAQHAARLIADEKDLLPRKPSKVFMSLRDEIRKDAAYYDAVLKYLEPWPTKLFEQDPSVPSRFVTRLHSALNDDDGPNLSLVARDQVKRRARLGPRGGELIDYLFQE